MLRTMHDMIQNIVFDMSGVLIRFDAHVFMQHAGAAPEDEELLKKEIYGSALWAQLDLGTITDAAAAAAICARVPLRLHAAVNKLVAMEDRPILPVPGMQALIRELKEKGYGIYLLSNTGLHQRNFWPRIPGSEYFDGTILSAEWHQVKPEPALYETLLREYRLKAEECFFTDDTAQNVAAARALGMAGCTFTGARALRDALRSAGVR